MLCQSVSLCFETALVLVLVSVLEENMVLALDCTIPFQLPSTLTALQVTSVEKPVFEPSHVVLRKLNIT